MQVFTQCDLRCALVDGLLAQQLLQRRCFCQLLPQPFYLAPATEQAGFDKALIATLLLVKSLLQRLFMALQGEYGHQAEHQSQQEAAPDQQGVGELSGRCAHITSHTAAAV